MRTVPPICRVEQEISFLACSFQEQQNFTKSGQWCFKPLKSFAKNLVFAFENRKQKN